MAAKTGGNVIAAKIWRAEVAGHISHLAVEIQGGRTIILAWAPAEATVIPA
jgi:hypothetical protein